MTLFGRKGGMHSGKYTAVCNSSICKYKGPEISQIEGHNERTKEKYNSNPDIDTSRSHLNFHLVIRKYPNLERGMSASETGRDHIPPRVFKQIRLISITHWSNDEWNGFADLLANLIEKYASVLDIDNLPEVKPICDGRGNTTVNDSDKNFTDSCIDSEKVA